ncbi:MAG TPA: ATP-binding protein [Candidatus Thermoplasmatota archaeon]
MREILRQKVVDSLAWTPPRLTRRDVHVPDVPGRAVAVIGPRRAGKTTFLWQLLLERMARGTPRERLLYLSFEDERLAGIESSHLQTVVDEYYALHPGLRDQRRTTWFLDEIQAVPGWERFARRIMDSERIELFLSGSSARLLSREVATSMRGRAVEALVYPFSFREFLRHRGREPDRPARRLPKAGRSALQRDLQEYLQSGGFPEVQGLGARDRVDVLRGLVDVALLRDVIERHRVTHPVALRSMARHLLANAAGLFSVNRFYRDLRSQGIPVAKDTLHAYLAHLEDAFLVRSVPVAAASERRRMVNPRKVFPIDPGLLPVFDRTGRANLGHALETAVLLALDRRGAHVSYVRTRGGREVDFLARYPGEGLSLIQVCAQAEGEALERELRALQEAAREHPRATLHLITLEPGPVEVPAGVALHRAWEWLMDAPGA